MVSKSRLLTTAVLAIALGAVGATSSFAAAPTQTTKSLFLRNTASGCSGKALTAVNGANAGNGCTNLIGSLSYVPGLGYVTTNTYSTLDDAAAKLPITVDASKPLTGQLSISTQNPTQYKVDVTVTMNDVRLPTVTVDSGMMTNIYFTSGKGTAFPFSIAIPAELDKVDVTSVSVELKETYLGAAWIELNNPASFLTIPAWSGSFGTGA